VVVATKTYASTSAGARCALTKALRELTVEAVDLFLLHAVGELESNRTNTGPLTTGGARSRVSC